MPFQILTTQEKIGHCLFLKGFITTSFRHYIQTTLSESAMAEVKAREIVVGIIHAMWESQYSFWTKYQEAQFDAASGDMTTRIHDQYQECRLRIQLLHSKQQQCLAAHRDMFFHSNVAEFLASATLTQMKAYLHQYEPAILHSVKAALKLTSRSLHEFPGFTFQRRSSRPPQTTVRPQSTRNGKNPHKHSRWKPGPFLNTLRDYFSQRYEIPREPP